jgi:cytochrome P450
MAANQRFRKYVDDQVNGRIALEKSGNGPSDIFKLLLDHKDKETGESMGFKELSDEAVVLIIAGQPSPFPLLTVRRYAADIASSSE